MTSWLGLTGRRAVVAGAGGIGAGLAGALADAGANVAVLDVDETRLAAVASSRDAGRGGVVTVAADLTSASSCRDAMDQASERLGGLDVFIHAVGMNDRRPVLDTPDEVLGKDHRDQFE